MKAKISTNFFLALIVSILLVGCGGTNKSTFINTDSSDMFMEVADMLLAGKDVPNEKWDELFATEGYCKSIEESFDEKGDFIRKAMNLAYNPSQVTERDSLTAIPVVEIISDWEALLIRIMLDNFIDIKENQSAMKKLLHSINGTKLVTDAQARLKNFFVNPVDSLIVPIPISILCMEPDALSHSGMIVWDANLFRKQSEEDRVNNLAHEMFHAYRRNFIDDNKTRGLMRLFNLWQNEGIADQIDKKSLSDLSSAFKRFGLPDSYVDQYNEIYENTPQTLQELEKLTLSFLNGEMDEKQYNSRLGGFIQFGGHPNAYYMSTTIKNAGYEKEMISTFTSPVEFVKLYNKSIAPNEAFGNEFMNYLEKLESEYLIDLQKEKNND